MMKLRFACMTVLLLFCAASTQAGLIAYWDFNDGSGTQATDIAGGHNGTLTNMDGSSDWVTGHTGGSGDYALDFDGNSQYVTAPSYQGQTGRAPRTISAWVNNSETDDVIVSYGTDNSSEKFVLRSQNSNGDPQTPRVEVNGGFQVGSTDIVDSGWKHVVATWENDGTPNVNDFKLYVNGVLETNSATQGYNLNTSYDQDFRIGGESFGTRHYHGQIDDVSVFNRPLTADEIMQLYTGTAPTAITTVAPKAGLNFDAALDTSPTNGTWEDVSAQVTNLNWAINNNGGGARLVDVSSTDFDITKAYTFNGTTDTATMGTLNNFSGDPSVDSASFEILFRPSDTLGQEILFETGGTGNGTSLSIDDAQLQFTASSATSATTKQLTYDGITEDFLHAVATIGRTGDDADLHLYVNGELVDSELGISNFLDWTGTDGAGLGDIDGTAGGNNTGLLNGFGNFAGDISFFRFYDTLLTGADAQALFDAVAISVVPEPSTFALAALGLFGFAGFFLRRKR